MHRYYYLKLSAAYVRGKSNDPENPLLEGKQADHRFPDHEMLFKKGMDKGLRLHRFKRNHSLSWVQKVLGILKSLQPANLLDIGTARVVFLWPLLDQFPWLPVTCLDRLDIMYGEWLYAKHTIYYDQLPHYFLEFDVLDTRTGAFLSTPCNLLAEGVDLFRVKP